MLNITRFFCDIRSGYFGRLKYILLIFLFCQLLEHFAFLSSTQSSDTHLEIIKISIELIFSAIKNTLLMSKEEISHFMKTDQCDYFSFPIIGTCIQILDNHFENLNCIHASINYPQLRDYFFVSRKYFVTQLNFVAKWFCDWLFSFENL